MALSNWLTRDEWNAIYFAGYSEAFDGKPCENLGDQLRLGIGALHRAGYAFRGIKSTASGDYEKVAQCCDGNESCLAEILRGNFDRLSRAKELVVFIERTPCLQSIDWSWLHEGIASNPEPETAS